MSTSSLSTTSKVDSTLSIDSLTYVCELVRGLSAIELDPSKGYMIEARLSTLARQRGFATTTELVQTVRTKREPSLEGQVVDAMTTNETSFYRDIHPFDAMRKTIIPELRDLLANKKRLNIWSAACSSGQEIYSIAMLLREHFPEFGSWKVDLLGTDLSDEILKRASDACFSQAEVNRGLPAPLMVKYFKREGMKWQLRSDLREMATFKKLNLIERWPSLPQMDVVFLRNVLIYFSPETKKMILKKIRQVMAPHCILFLGGSETTMNLDSSFERIQIEKSVFYRIK